MLYGLNLKQTCLLFDLSLGLVQNLGKLKGLKLKLLLIAFFEL